jgi:hypothetical protein
MPPLSPLPVVGAAPMQTHGLESPSKLVVGRCVRAGDAQASALRARETWEQLAGGRHHESRCTHTTGADCTLSLVLSCAPGSAALARDVDDTKIRLRPHASRVEIGQITCREWHADSLHQLPDVGADAA